SITTKPRYGRPAALGGIAMGVLSALPIVAVGNICCLWVAGGGLLAAYLLQQDEPAAITAADRALVGLLAGVIGAFVYLIASIPVTIIVAPLEQAVLQRLRETATGMPPPFRDYMGGYIGGFIGTTIGFMFMLFVG